MDRAAELGPQRREHRAHHHARADVHVHARRVCSFKRMHACTPARPNPHARSTHTHAHTNCLLPRGEPLGWHCLPDGSLFASPTPGLPSGRLWGAANGEPPPPALLTHALAPARLVLTVPSLMLADTCICTAALRDGARSLPLMPAVTAIAILVVGGLATFVRVWVRNYEFDFNRVRSVLRARGLVLGGVLRRRR